MPSFGPYYNYILIAWLTQLGKYNITLLCPCVNRAVNAAISYANASPGGPGGPGKPGSPGGPSDPRSPIDP